ncbi:MAG TPA: ribosome maturation factor RimM [Polyangiaceae bacterium]|nr:ribosome maturation factor RimM [Polyangiaceae bacterium]
MTASAAAGDLLLIGRVARAHGLQGALRIELHFAGSDALEHVSELWLSERAEDTAGAVCHPIAWARAVPKAYLVKLEGVSERNGADALRGKAVWVARAALPAADPSEYYLVDLIGARVVGPEVEVGTVSEVVTHPSVDVLVIRTPDGRMLEQPLVPDWIKRVSVEERLVELSSLEGLIG